MNRLSPFACELCEASFLRKAGTPSASLILSLPRKAMMAESAPRAILVTIVPHRYEVCDSCAELVKSILTQREAFLEFARAWRGRGAKKAAPVRSIDVVQKEEDLSATEACTQPWTQEGTTQ